MTIHSIKKISVLLSVFNGQNFLRESIESVLQQDYPDVELVVCDDGSTDRTGEIIREYSFRGNFVSVGHSKNKGKVFSFQKAFQASSGDYVALMAHDDALPKNSLSRRFLFLQQSNYNLAYCNGMTCNQFLEPIRPIYEYRGDLIFERDFRSVCWNNQVAGGLFLFRRGFFEELLPIDPVLKFEDWWLTWMSLIRNRRIPFQDEFLYFYRIHDSNDNGSNVTDYKLNGAFRRDWARHGEYYDAFARHIKENEFSEELKEDTLAYLGLAKEGKQRAVRGELTLSPKFWAMLGFKKLVVLNAVALGKIHWLQSIMKGVRNLRNLFKQKFF